MCDMNLSMAIEDSILTINDHCSIVLHVKQVILANPSGDDVARNKLNTNLKESIKNAIG